MRADHGRRGLTDINITPLVDVLLILVVVLLLLVPAMARTLSVDLPQPSVDAAQAPASSSRLVLTPEGLTLDGVAVTPAELRGKIRGLSGIVLFADKTVSYSQVAEVLAALQAERVTRVELAVQ